MRDHLTKLHEAARLHKAACAEFQKAHDRIHEIMSQTGKALVAKAGGDAQVLGHIGQFAKCAKLHAQAHEVHKAAQDMLHSSLDKAIQGIADRAGITVGYQNPNLGTQPNRGETDLSAPGEISNLPTRLDTAKSLSAVGQHALLKQMAVGFGKRFTRQVVNKNVGFSYGFSKSTPVSGTLSGQQPKVLSEFEKRQR